MSMYKLYLNPNKTTKPKGIHFKTNFTITYIYKIIQDTIN